MIKFENKSKNKKGKSHRFFGVSSKIQRSSNLLFPLLARGLEGIKCILNTCACFYAQNYSIRRSLEFFANAKNRDDVLLRKVLALALVLILGVAGELRAACNDNIGQDCGTNCCYTKDEQNNYIFYKDPTAPANSEAIITNPVNSAAGNHEAGDYQNAVTAKIEYGITQIGRNAFDRSTKLVSINIPNSVTVIDYDAFWMANSLENIEIPDSVTKIGATAFGTASRNYKMKSILLPENIQEFHNRAFVPGYLPEGFTVYCKNKSAEQCKKLLTAKGGNAGLTYGDGIGCARISGTLGCTKCMINYKQNENFCNRVRYTPAEAASIASDDNTNIVTLTFKK